MADYCETPDIDASCEGGVLALPRSSAVRFTLPMVYAGMGIALGILTGTSLAITGVPESSPVALFSNSAPASTTQSSANAMPVVAHTQTAAYVPVVYVQPAAVRVSSPAEQPTMLVPTVHRAVISKHVSPRQIFPAKTRLMLQTPVLPATPSERRTSRPVAHPVVKPARRLLASAPSPLQMPLGDAPPQLDSVAATSTFFTEGDLLVVAYDAATGTIQSADGRTFAVGQTVSLSDATGWNDYRSEVHYRCGGNGSCTLMRPGVIAADARLI